MKASSLLYLFIFAISLSARAQDDGEKMTNKELSQLIDSISFSVKNFYIYPDKGIVIEKALRAQLKNGAYKNIQNRRELANAMNEDIRKAHYDGHMRLMYNPELERMLLTPMPFTDQKSAQEEDLKAVRTRNFAFIKTEVMPGNIGYVRWDGFEGYTEEARPTYESAFRFVSNTDALIIDMRYNGGGSPQTVNAMLNYFFNKRLPMNHIIDYRRDTIKNYTNPSTSPFILTMPVYILTQRRTFSGAEDFTYAMKVAKRATIVGDTTGGGAHPTGPCTLGQGFVINLPNARSWHELTNTNWERVGIAPDVFVRGDLALEKARTLIFEERFKTASNEQEKKIAKGQLTALENKLVLAQNGSINLSPEQLQALFGVYKPVPGPGASPVNLTILVKGNTLYRSIPIPPDWKLLPISANRFVYENDESNRFMEFAFDKDGHPTGLTIFYPDREFVYERVK
jgi:hypothetical protein